MRTLRALARAVWAALPAAGLTTATAFAQQSAFRLEYDAPSDCPAEARVAERVLSHCRRGKLAASDELARTMDLSIRPDRREYVGVLSFVDLESRPVRRELRASTCDELVEALVLVTALAIDAQTLSEAWLGRVDAPTEYYAPSWAAELAWAPADTVVDRTAFETRRGSAGSRFTALVLARVNTAAVPGWGMGVAGFLAVPWPGARYTTEVGVGWGGGSTSVLGESARFDVAHGVARVCAWYGPLDVVQAGACGGAEAGVLLGRAHETRRISQAYARSSAWFALGVVGRSRLRLGSRFSLESELGALAPLYRPRFELDLPNDSRNLSLFRSPRIGLVTGLGLGLALD